LGKAMSMDFEDVFVSADERYQIMQSVSRLSACIIDCGWDSVAYN
jgi:hypothetical protein